MWRTVVSTATRVAAATTVAAVGAVARRSDLQTSWSSEQRCAEAKASAPSIRQTATNSGTNSKSNDQANTATHFNVVVVGGGIVGCSVAYHAAQTQRKLGEPVSVAVIERQAVGSGASGLSAGTIWAAGLPHHGTELGYDAAVLGAATVDILKALELRGFDCRFRQTGALTVATTAEQVGSW